MGGKPFKVGRFAHLLRVRLMREHLGIDVDALDEEELDQNIHAGLAGNAETDSAEAELKVPGRQLPSRGAQNSPQEGKVIRHYLWAHFELRFRHSRGGPGGFKLFNNFHKFRSSRASPSPRKRENG